jgi:hypothetical protein
LTRVRVSNNSGSWARDKSNSNDEQGRGSIRARFIEPRARQSHEREKARNEQDDDRPHPKAPMRQVVSHQGDSDHNPQGGQTDAKHNLHCSLIHAAIISASRDSRNSKDE